MDRLHMNDFKLLPCPFCGHKPDMNNLIDSLHGTGHFTHLIDKDDPEQLVHYNSNPENAISQIWQFSCLEHEGGCGAQVIGECRIGAVNAWNQRKWPIQ